MCPKPYQIAGAFSSGKSLTSHAAIPDTARAPAANSGAIPAGGKPALSRAGGK